MPRVDLDGTLERANRVVGLTLLGKQQSQVKVDAIRERIDGNSAFQMRDGLDNIAAAIGEHTLLQRALRGGSWIDDGVRQLQLLSQSRGDGAQRLIAAHWLLDVVLNTTAVP